MWDAVGREQMAMPIPNNPGTAKFWVLAGGLAAGVAGGVAIHHALPSSEGATSLEAAGEKPMTNEVAASVVAAGSMFGAAAGVSLGFQRRTPTSGLTTGMQVATAALLSTAAGAVIDADTDRAQDKAVGLGVMLAMTGAGIALGIRDEVRPDRARLKGLGLGALAVGLLLPVIAGPIAQAPGQLLQGFKHRDA